MNKNVTELFCFVDDFCKAMNKNFAEKLLPSGKKPTRMPEITHSEILTIILLYHQFPSATILKFSMCIM